MRILLPILTVALLGVASSIAFSQHDHGTATAFPDVCKSEATAMGISAHEGHDTGALQDHQKASIQGMKEMDRDMMQGMMQDDADVAFMCGMIAHHQGAIDMAKVEIEFGDDAFAKEFAQKIIDAQTKEIAEMTEWLSTNAK